jgi:predicted acylesterase/phospholipase RssA
MSLSLTITLSGGAALGAYEAGATAAVLEAVHELREAGEDVSIDAFGGASAGALVAVFAAYSHVNGIDPVWLLREAWVERVSLSMLRGRGLHSPLGFQRLRERIGGLLDPRDATGGPAHRRTDAPGEHEIGLHIALTGLRGLHYQVDGLGVLNPVRATTYADWGGFTLEPGGGPGAILEPEGSSILDFVLASASNPGAFAPYVLDRRQDTEEYEANGIEDLPASGRLWYTDGGTLQVEPIGRVLTAARKARAATGRAPADHNVVLLVDPRSEMPARNDEYSGDGTPPTWLTGISRSLAIIPAQILYDDLRRVEKMNSRLSWTERLVDAVAPHLDAGATQVLAEKLGEFRAEVEQLGTGARGDTDPADRSTSPRPGAGHGAPADDDRDPRRVLHELLSFVVGLEGKHRTEVDVISPLLLTDEAPRVTGLLAGEMLGDFGGFLDHSLRESDFLLGYDSTLTWLPENLRRLEIAPDVADRVTAHTRERVPRRWEDANRGEAELSDLRWSARLGLGRLVARMGAVLAKDVLSGLRPKRFS